MAEKNVETSGLVRRSVVSERIDEQPDESPDSKRHGFLTHYIQNGSYNTQINAETYNLNSPNVKQQNVHGTVQLHHAHVDQLTQNSFSGPVVVRANSFATQGSRLTIFPATASLLRTSYRLHRELTRYATSAGSNESRTAFLHFHERLQQMQSALKPGQQNEHRLDLISLQDYFLVLIQAFQLFTDIDQNIADLDMQDQGDLDEDSIAKCFEIQSVDNLNEQLTNQCDVLTSVTYVDAQESARKVVMVGDQNSVRYSSDLADMNRRVRQIQKLLGSMIDRSTDLGSMFQDNDKTSGGLASAIQTEWEKELMESPAYSRVLQLAVTDRFSISTRQSSARQEAWPFLDLISLANLSIISVVGLPVVWDNISRNQRNELSSILDGAESQDHLPDSTKSSPARNPDTVNHALRQSDSTFYELKFVQRILLQTSPLRSLAGRQDMWRAISSTDEDRVSSLISQGVQPWFRDRKSGLTPLEKVAAAGNLRLVEILLATNPTGDAEKWIQHSALNLAIENNHLDVVLALHPYYKNSVWVSAGRPAPLDLAATLGHWRIVRSLLLVTDYDINRPGHHSSTTPPLILAIEKGHLSVVEILLADSRIDPNIVHDQWLKTPLMIAICYDRTAIAKVLLAHQKTDLRAQGTSGETALYYAFARQNDAIAQEILEKDSSTLTSAAVLRFGISSNIPEAIAVISTLSQKIVCEHVIENKDGTLLRAALLGYNNLMVRTLLSHTAFKTARLVASLLEQAISTDDQILVCTLRNYIWCDIIPHEGNCEVSFSCLKRAIGLGYHATVREVLIAIDWRAQGIGRADLGGMLAHIDTRQQAETLPLRDRQFEFLLSKLYHCAKLSILPTFAMKSQKQEDKYEMMSLLKKDLMRQWTEMPARTLVTPDHAVSLQISLHTFQSDVHLEAWSGCTRASS